MSVSTVNYLHAVESAALTHPGYVIPEIRGVTWYEETLQFEKVEVASVV